MLNLLISIFLLLPGCNDLDIIVLADYSSSVDGNEKFIYSAISSFERGLDISPDNVNLGVVVFNNYSEVICPLEGNLKEINDRIALLSDYLASGTTNLSSALYSAFDEFNTRGREGYKKIVIVISDGQPDSPEDTYKITQQLKLVGIEIFTIMINDEVSNPEYMKSISSKNNFYNTDYQGLVKTLEQLNLCL